MLQDSVLCSPNDMKTTVSLFFFLLFLTGLNAEAQTHLIWTSREHVLNTTANLTLTSVTNSEGVTMLSEQAQDATLGGDLNYFMSFDSSGIKQWEFHNDTCYGNCDESYPFIIPMNSGGGLFLGSFTDNTGSVQFRMKRISSGGNLVWQQFWITPFLSVRPVDFAIDHAGNLDVAFAAFTDSSSQEDFVVAQFDTTSGLLNWYMQAPDGGQPGTPLAETITSICVDAQNNVYACGHAIAMTGANESYLLAIDQFGALNFRLPAGPSGPDSDVRKVITDNNGFVYTGGFVAETLQVAKINTATQAVVWTKSLTRDTADLSFVDFEYANNKLFLLNNYRYYYPDTSVTGGRWHNQHYSITQYDLSGNAVNHADYLTTLDANGRQDGSGGAVNLYACNGSFYILSSQILTGSGNRFAIIEKIDEATLTSSWHDTASINNDPGRLGFDANCDVFLSFSYDYNSSTVYSVLNKYSDAITNTVPEVALGENFVIYPNPAGNTLNIRLPETLMNGPVLMEVYSVSGQLVSSNRTSAVPHSIETGTLASGFYILKLTLDNQKPIIACFSKQ